MQQARMFESNEIDGKPVPAAVRGPGVSRWKALHTFRLPRLAPNLPCGSRKKPSPRLQGGDGFFLLPQGRFGARRGSRNV